MGPLPGRLVWAVPKGEAWEHGVTWKKQVNLGLATEVPTSDPKKPGEGGGS